MKPLSALFRSLSKSVHKARTPAIKFRYGRNRKRGKFEQKSLGALETPVSSSPAPKKTLKKSSQPALPSGTVPIMLNKGKLAWQVNPQLNPETGRLPMSQEEIEIVELGGAPIIKPEKDPKKSSKK